MISKRRFRRGNFSSFEISAPVSLMKTSETPIGMSTQYAVDIENMLPTKRRRISKRKGLTKLTISGITGSIIAGRALGLSDGTFKLLVCNDAGSIFTSDAITDLTSTITFTEDVTGQDTTGTYRFTYFNQKLIIVNGVDPNLVWDGSTITEIKEFVIDGLGTSFTKVDTDTFTFTDGGSRGTSDYPAGRNIKVFMDGSSTAIDAVVLSSSGTTGGTITVNLTTNVLTGTTIDEVQYEDSPQPFSFIYAAHDRLWALSGGELKARSFRSGTDGLTVYYTENTNNENGWFNASTQNVPFINMSDKHLKNDEFVGIALYQEKLVFFGRQNTQIWSGTDPTGATSDLLSWARTFPVGCVNGDLIQQVENDILFVTNNEVRQFSVVTITNDLESSQEKGANIAERVSKQVGKLIAKDADYKSARSFLFPRGGFVGFRMPDEVLIRVEEQDFEGWCRFTQLFQQCRDYTIAPDGRMYCFFEGNVYYYGQDEDVYADDGAAIRTSWTTPWLQPKEGSLFNGRYYEFITEAGDEMNVQVTRYKNNSNCFAKQSTIVVNPQRSAYWDEAFWDVDAWDCETDTLLPTKEDKFISETFRYSIKTETTTGALDIVALRIYGRVER